MWPGPRAPGNPEGRELAPVPPILSGDHLATPRRAARAALDAAELLPVTPLSETPLDRTARRFRLPLAVGLLLSVLVHLVLFAVTGRSEATLASGAGPAARAVPPRPPAPVPDALHALNVREVRPEVIRVPARPRAVTAEPPAVEAASSAEDLFAGAELAAPSGAGPGGAGAAGGEGDDGARIATPPVPRSVMPEWNAPASARGLAVTVRVRVDSAGAPTGPVVLEPRTPDEDFNRRLASTVRAMRFSPARTADGRAVAAWAELTFTF